MSTLGMIHDSLRCSADLQRLIREQLQQAGGPLTANTSWGEGSQQPTFVPPSQPSQSGGFWSVPTSPAPAQQTSPAASEAGEAQEMLVCVPSTGGTRSWKPQDLFSLDPSAHPPAEKGTRADTERKDFLDEHVVDAISKVCKFNDDLQRANMMSKSNVKSIAIGHLYKLHNLIQKDLRMALTPLITDQDLIDANY